MQRLAIVVALLVSSCRASIAEPPEDQRIQVERPGPTVTFAVIGDFGLDSPAEADVATLVHGWSPELILTLGDNNYPSGAASTIDANVGKHYHDFIAPYRGAFGSGASSNRFFPTLGNHDWRTWDLSPYLEYFQLPGNERYYDFVWGPVHFFAIDSDTAEPDGTSADGKQARWLRDALAGSESVWRVVYMHHPPYSSGDHGSTPRMQWPYIEWGADVVMAGHDHHYERLQVDEGVFVVNGLGGNPKRYGLGRPRAGSKIRFNEQHGAMRVSATAQSFELQFVSIDGVVVDRLELTKPGAQSQDALAPPSGDLTAPDSEPGASASGSAPESPDRPDSAPPNFDAYED